MCYLSGSSLQGLSVSTVALVIALKIKKLIPFFCPRKLQSRSKWGRLNRSGYLDMFFPLMYWLTYQVNNVLMAWIHFSSRCVFALDTVYTHLAVLWRGVSHSVMTCWKCDPCLITQITVCCQCCWNRPQTCKVTGLGSKPWMTAVNSNQKSSMLILSLHFSPVSLTTV